MQQKQHMQDMQHMQQKQQKQQKQRLSLATLTSLTLVAGISVLSGCGGDSSEPASAPTKEKSNPAASMMQRKADEMQDERQAPAAEPATPE